MLVPTGGGQGGATTLLLRLLSISASEARADVAEVYGAKKDYASTTKVEMAIIAASEARADVAEVYASKREDGEWKGKEHAVVSVPKAKAEEVAEVHASKANSVAAKDGEFKGKEPALSSYWGIAPSRLVNKDGVEWKWSCFKVSAASSLC
jgi:ubiquinol oxidase